MFRQNIPVARGVPIRAQSSTQVPVVTTYRRMKKGSNGPAQKAGRSRASRFRLQVVLQLLGISSGGRNLRVVALHSNDFIQGCRGRPGDLFDGGHIEYADRGQAASLPYHEFVSSAHEVCALGPRAIQLDRACLAHLLREGSARHKPADFKEDIESHGHWFD